MRPETYAEIDLDALTHNMAEMRRLAGKAEILAVLKANAYGHGAVEVFKALIGCGITRFAVANFSEAMELRLADPQASIMILGYVAPQNIAPASENNFVFTVFSRDYWETIKANAVKPVTVHIKVNTGFNRIGFDNNDDSFACIKEISQSPMATIEGAYSHFALTSEAEDVKQYQRFMAFVDRLEEMGIPVPVRHIADSIGAVIYDWSRLDMVRLGAIMYGLKAGRKEYEQLDLRPTMKLYSTVNQVRTLEVGDGVSYDYVFTAPEKMQVATMAFGYADGPPRRMGNAGHVVINGKKAPLIGLMCMDQCVADLRGIDGVKAGDKALIFDLAEDSPASVYDLARLLKTNKNDVIAGIGKRVTRIYSQGGREWSVNDINPGK